MENACDREPNEQLMIGTTKGPAQIDGNSTQIRLNPDRPERDQVAFRPDALGLPSFGLGKAVVEEGVEMVLLLGRGQKAISLQSRKIFVIEFPPCQM